MDNIIDFNKIKPASKELIEDLIAEHKEDFIKRFGSTPVPGEPERVTLSRELLNIDTMKVSMAFIRNNTSYGQDDNAFTQRRDDAEFKKAMAIMDRLRQLDKDDNLADRIDDILDRNGITYEENKKFNEEMRKRLNLD